MTEQLNLTLSELATAKNDFTAQYQAADPEVSFPWDITVNWLELVSAIEQGISWAPDETLLRFIHRYDEDGWFLTMECCHVAEDGTIDAFGSRFDLRNGQIAASTGFTADYDQNYFDNIEYEGKPLVRGTHVNNLIFPWSQELKEAASVNGVLNSEDAEIVFSSISFDFGNDSPRVNVRWPHTIAFFFSGPGGDLLDNVAYGGILVKNKAYDYARPCPDDCTNIYSWPSFFSTTQPYLVS
jgi:hypothetical protein